VHAQGDLDGSRSSHPLPQKDTSCLLNSPWPSCRGTSATLSTLLEIHTHTPRQIRQLTKTIETFGFTNPALLAPDGTFLAGHGRVAGAKLLGMVEVPTIELAHLTEDQIRAYVIADNKLALMQAG
jgi:hypothetical protein